VNNRKGELNGTLHSATLLAKSTNLKVFAKEWGGTIQWIAQSPYRKFHKRKNWFIAVAIFSVEEQLKWNPKDVVFET
jgi:peptide chain release factor